MAGTMSQRITFLHNSLNTAFQNILVDIAHLQNGYAFVYTLQRSKFQKSRLRKWTKLLTGCLYNTSFRNGVILACLDENGITTQRTQALYNWAVRYLYDNHENELYRDWVSLNQKDKYGRSTSRHSNYMQ